MNSETYIQQEIEAGLPIHRHRGVWWQASAPGRYRPVLPVQQIVPRAARPKFTKSPVGYSHLVPAGALSNGRAAFYVIPEERLRTYSFENLRYEKRKAVSKARRGGLTVARLTDLEPFWADLQALAISTAERNGYGRPAESYRTHFAEWQQAIRKDFAKPGREWWGVFQGQRLGAYLYSYLIDDTMHLYTTKVHSDFLPQRASDLLYFVILEYCRDLPECRQVNTGRTEPGAPTVDRFKESLGFERVEMGEYVFYNPLIRLPLQWLLRFHRYAKLSEPGSGEGAGAGRLRRFYSHALKMARRVESLPAERSAPT